MIYLVFLVSLILTLICWKRRRLSKEKNNRSLGYFFLDRSVEFLMCITLVTFFYSILAWIVNGTSDKTTLGRLENLQNFLDATKSLVTSLKLSPRAAVLALLAVVVFDLFLFRIFQASIVTHFKSYQKWMRRLYIIIVLLCSFTFFGAYQIDEGIAHLRLRTDKITTGYASIQEEVEDSLAAAVQRELYEKIRSAFPTDVLNYPTQVHEAVSALRVSYQEAQRYNVGDPEVARIINRYQIKQNESLWLADKTVIYDEAASKSAQQRATIRSSESTAQNLRKNNSIPSNLTVESVEQTLTTLKNKPTLRSRFITLIKSESGKQLLAQFPRVLTGAIKSRIFESVIAQYPILGPVVDVFVGTFDKNVEERVRQSADRLAASLTKNPQDAENIISAEVKTIVNTIEVKIPATAQNKIDQIAAQQTNNLTQIENAKIRVEEQVSIVQTREVSEAVIATGSDDRVECQCFCEGRLLWTRTLTKAECQAQCPTGMPCG